jgi:hypothetical protein
MAIWIPLKNRFEKIYQAKSDDRARFILPVGGRQAGSEFSSDIVFHPRAGWRCRHPADAADCSLVPLH